MSILRAKFPPKVFLCNTLTTSDVRHMQSLMLLPFMKPLCWTDVIAGIMEESLSAKIFDITLNLKFTIAIGLNCSAKSALLVLGIRAIILVLKLGNNQPEVKKMHNSFEHIMLDYFPICLKNIAPKPSGPGALSLFRSKTTLEISSRVGNIISILFIRSVISFGTTSSIKPL
jgi:hypothetical protein